MSSAVCTATVVACIGLSLTTPVSVYADDAPSPNVGITSDSSVKEISDGAVGESKSENNSISHDKNTTASPNEVLKSAPGDEVALDDLPSNSEAVDNSKGTVEESEITNDTVVDSENSNGIVKASADEVISPNTETSNSNNSESNNLEKYSNHTRKSQDPSEKHGKIRLFNNKNRDDDIYFNLYDSENKVQISNMRPLDEQALQEIFRELNTSSVKCNLYDISKIIVESKAEVEKMREQVQNVE